MWTLPRSCVAWRRESCVSASKGGAKNKIVGSREKGGFGAFRALPGTPYTRRGLLAALGPPFGALHHPPSGDWVLRDGNVPKNASRMAYILLSRAARRGRSRRAGCVGWAPASALASTGAAGSPAGFCRRVDRRVVRFRLGAGARCTGVGACCTGLTSGASDPCASSAGRPSDGEGGADGSEASIPPGAAAGTGVEHGSVGAALTARVAGVSTGVACGVAGLPGAACGVAGTAWGVAGAACGVAGATLTTVVSVACAAVAAMISATAIGLTGATAIGEVDVAGCLSFSAGAERTAVVPAASRARGTRLLAVRG